MTISSLRLVNCSMGSDSFGILVETVTRKWIERGLWLTRRENAYTVFLKCDPSLTDDRYILTPIDNGIELRAGNDVSLHAAFGRFMLDSFADGHGHFIPTEKAVDFTPASPLRGMYFATHFANFYHSAPLPLVYEVIQDLALRGCNNLLLWFDMHHFNSMDDPAAVALTNRLRAIFRYANRIGIAGSLTMLSNEGFASSPEELRAEWTVQNGYLHEPGGHYHVEICPSKEGGTEEILRERAAMLDRFYDLKIDYVCYWPYDQGGCTCAKCAPWGANGFLRLLPRFAELIREKMPNTKIILSAWYFDHFVNGEWDGLYDWMKDGLPDGVEYLMSFFHHGKLPPVLAENGIPAGVKMIDFPEISMHHCQPWGGFGASAIPDFLQETYDGSGHLYSGGFPYSEGVFEDVNKFTALSFYAGLYPTAEEAVRAYVRTEFCVDGDELEELTRGILLSEHTLHRVGYLGDEIGSSDFPFEIKTPEDVEEVDEIFAKYDALLPEKIRTSRNFRLWRLRGIIDRELKENGFIPARSVRCQEAMKELCALYYADETTNPWVCPPYRF